MNVDQYRDFLLENLPNAKSAAGGREVVTDCPFCGKPKHFYIGMPTSDKPSMYNCFVCTESGIVTEKFLQAYFGAYTMDGSIERFLKEKSKDYDTSIKYNKIANSFYLVNPVAYPNEINFRKLSYINERLGLKLTLEEAAANKIVLNLYDLLSYNKIPKLTRDPRIVQNMNDYFLGFISMDNGYINLRKLTNLELHPSINKRYVNYAVVPNTDNHRRYYVIPTQIDRVKPINVHIAEGPFDILSIKYNLRYNEPNSIFIAGCGKSYLNVIKLLIEDFGFATMNIHIYMDNDDDIKNILFIENYLSVFKYPFFIHKNIFPGEKDFGVPLDRIDEYVEQI